MKHGFTILELVVVIAISATITAGGIASYSTFSKQQKLVNETKKFEDTLDTAREKAQASENADLCDSGYSLFAYQVDVSDPDSNGLQNVSVSAFCVNGVNTQNKQASSYPVDKSVTIQNTPFTVRFALLSGNVLVGAPFTYTLLSNSSKSKCVSISSLGVIDEISCSGG